MENNIFETQAVEQTIALAEKQLVELNDLQLALIGGGIADVVFG